MVPQPVSAVMVLSPMTEKISRKRRQLHSESVASTGKEDSSEHNGVWYMKQRIRNACGTIAVMHALANAPTSVQEASIQPSSWINSFFANNPISSSPTNKAISLENDSTIETFHENATNDPSNQTSRGNIGDTIDMHFVSLVHVNGKLYELDGRVDQGPICHGKTTQKDLLADACRVVKQLMEADPAEMRFTIIAFAPKAS